MEKDLEHALEEQELENVTGGTQADPSDLVLSTNGQYYARAVATWSWCEHFICKYCNRGRYAHQSHCRAPKTSNECCRVCGNFDALGPSGEGCCRHYPGSK